MVLSRCEVGTLIQRLLVGAFKQENGEGPGKVLLRDCKTSNFAEVRFQL